LRTTFPTGSTFSTFRYFPSSLGLVVTRQARFNRRPGSTFAASISQPAARTCSASCFADPKRRSVRPLTWKLMQSRSPHLPLILPTSIIRAKTGLPSPFSGFGAGEFCARTGDAFGPFLVRKAPTMSFWSSSVLSARCLISPFARPETGSENSTEIEPIRPSGLTLRFIII